MSEAEVPATPAAAELAQANEVDLSEVEGTGAGGKVTVADVTSHVEASGGEVVPVDPDRIGEMRDEAEQQPADGDNELKPITGNGAEPSETAPVPEFTLDVDVDTIEEAEYEGELPALILAGYWVKLGVHDDVPEEHVGAIANVVESPWTNVPFAGDSDETITGYRFDEEKLFLVKLRGAGEELLSVPAEAIADSAQDRPTLLAYA